MYISLNESLVLSYNFSKKFLGGLQPLRTSRPLIHIFHYLRSSYRMRSDAAYGTASTVGYAITNSFYNKIRMLQRTRRNTVSRRSTRMLVTCRAFPLWLERQSSSLLSFVRYIYQFSLVIFLFAPLAVKIYFFFIILPYNFSHEPAK